MGFRLALVILDGTVAIFIDIEALRTVLAARREEICLAAAGFLSAFAHGTSTDLRAVGIMDFSAVTRDALITAAKSLKPRVAVVPFLDILHVIGHADSAVTLSTIRAHHSFARLSLRCLLGSTLAAVTAIRAWFCRENSR